MFDTVAPESVGMSAERLARIDTAMNDAVQNDRLPGIMTLVQRRGEIVQFGTYGHMNIEASHPIGRDNIFRIYSMTKPIVSIAIMMLLEEGKLLLNEPVGQYIPAFRKMRIYSGMSSFNMQLTDASTIMTIHHLLTHTAGLSYGFFVDHPVDEMYRQLSDGMSRETPLEDYINALGELPLLFEPGEKWRYSVATDVLGYLVQVIADMPLADFLQERIFDPLGMTDTGFMVAEENTSRLAQIYMSEGLYDPQPFEPQKTFGVGDVTTPTQRPLGGAGLTSTLDDYLRFANCLLNGGELDGFRLIAPRTLRWMASDHLEPHMLPIKLGPGKVGTRFGLGFRVVKNIGESQVSTSVGEFGWSGAAQTYFSIAPAEDMILLYMSQLIPAHPYPVRNRFVNLVYQAIME
ncbi:MAG: serine hydrolase domain-containing protein [Chloroflexota bacterium]